MAWMEMDLLVGRVIQMALVWREGWFEQCAELLFPLRDLTAVEAVPRPAAGQPTPEGILVGVRRSGIAIHPEQTMNQTCIDK